MSSDTPHPDFAELDALLKRLCENELDDAGFVRLDALLSDNPELQARYVDVMSTHQMLGSMMRATSGPIPLEAATAVQQRIDATRRTERGRGPRVWRYAAAAIVALAAGVTMMLWSSGGRDATTDADTATVAIDDTPTDERNVATLTNTTDAKWDTDTGALLDPGMPLDRGRLRLLAGSAEMLMESTASVTLLGPADVETLGPNRCRLTRGRIVAKVPPAAHGSLVAWARRGVLLLNSVLSVEQGLAGAHQGKGWERFTDRVVSLLDAQERGLVFMLWGSYAQKKGAQIDDRRHCVLRAPHPSPLSAHRGFFGCRHFSRANEWLAARGAAPVDWELPPLAEAERLAAEPPSAQSSSAG